MISISTELKERVPELCLGIISSEVKVEPSPDALWKLIEAQCGRLAQSLQIDQITSLPLIKASRKAYKATGKDPARYRLSAEALIRRVVKERSLYRINNVVDLLNLVSVTYGFSIGGYDADCIHGNIVMGIGQPDEPYTGIGRGELNIENLPVFRDEWGAFGSPTSDSERTAVGEQTKNFLMVLIGFGGLHDLQEACEYSAGLLKEFASATQPDIKLID